MEQHGTDRRPNLLAASIVTSTIALTALCLRFISRLGSKKSGLWWDDWLALASSPFIITFIGLNAWYVSKGLGLHLPRAREYGSPVDWQFILYIENQIYNTGLSCVKLSVLFFYLRVFKAVRSYKYAIWFGIFLALSWCIGNNLLAAFECWPVHAFWDKEIPHTCINTLYGFLGTTISNVAVDLYILLLPIPMLWKLQLFIRRKIGIIFIFLCGYCVVVVAVLRIVSIVGLGEEIRDYPWDFVIPQMMVALEMPIGLFASCLPAVFQLISRCIERKRFGTAASSKPISKDANIGMGMLGNPVSNRENTHFTQLISPNNSNP